MMFSARNSRLVVAGTIGTGALVSTTLFGAIPSALANPPNCTTADLEGVRSGVSASTSAYLFTHPDVNYFFTSLEGLSRDQVRAQVKTYMANNPQVKADLTGIRQPLVDIRDRCGAPPGT